MNNHHDNKHMKPLKKELKGLCTIYKTYLRPYIVNLNWKLIDEPSEINNEPM